MGTEIRALEGRLEANAEAETHGSEFRPNKTSDEDGSLVLVRVNETGVATEGSIQFEETFEAFSGNDSRSWNDFDFTANHSFPEIEL